ncbi:MAG: ATP-binding protein [Candidatus Bathyarchaeia archaeon]|jgi:predicted AAA+ superfamily ATPase
MNLENALIRYRDYSKTVELIKRDVTLHEGNFINAIVGPRRAGKTSLMLLYMKGLENEERNKVFINCEDIDFFGITVDDLSKLEETIYHVYKPNETKDIYLFIDEVQTFPEWSRWLRTLFDEHRYKIFVTGSTSDLSLDKIPSELRGRSNNTLVLPFSFKECLRAKEITFEKYMQAEDTGKVIGAFSEFLDFGGYPEVIKTENPVLKQTLLSDLYATVIQRDLIEKFKVRKAAVFRAFINSLFGSVCRNVSIPALVNWFSSHGAKISKVTALNYLNYAEATFLFFLVYPYSRRIKERNTRPKLYVSDSGILGLFDSDKGKKLENTVLVELIRRREQIHYYKTETADIDFVLTKENKACELIQVSYSINESETYARETKSLLETSEKMNCPKLTIVTFNEEKKIEQNGKTIEVIPAWKWLLQTRA